MVLTAEQQERLRARLLEERERLQTDLVGLNAEVISLGVEQRLDGGIASNHIADDASDVMSQENDLALMINLQDRIRDIDRALVRMDEGTYGICERCDNPINPERLEALPSATLCITCKSIVDKQHPFMVSPRP